MCSTNETEYGTSLDVDKIRYKKIRDVLYAVLFNLYPIHIIVNNPIVESPYLSLIHI